MIHEDVELRGKLWRIVVDAHVAGRLSDDEKEKIGAALYDEH